MNGMNIVNNYTNSSNHLPYINNPSSQQPYTTSSPYQYNQPNHQSNSIIYSQRRSETPSDPSSSASNSYIMSELKSMKQLIKATYESQTEMQSKVIEYNRVISHQENIIRLNNIKLSEHDTKLTDILLSFDNYLKLHDKSSKIVNEVQRRLDNTVSISDYSDFKMNYSSHKSIVDNQIASLYHTNEETQYKLLETSKESKSLQELLIDKVKNVEGNFTHMLLDLQRNQMKTLENKDQAMTSQLSQLKGLIQLSENSIGEEVNRRKGQLDAFRNEVIVMFRQFDEKFGRYEKSQLETEKNLIHLNKDYVNTFQELLLKQKEKTEIELSSIRSLYDGSIAKCQMNFEENITSVKEHFNKLSIGLIEQKTTSADLELFVRDHIKGFNQRLDEAQKGEIDTKDKLETLTKALNTYIQESLSNFTKLQEETYKSFSAQFYKTIEELDISCKRQLEVNRKEIHDINEKTEQITSALEAISKVNSGAFVNQGGLGNSGNGEGDNQSEHAGHTNEYMSLRMKIDNVEQKMSEIEERIKKDTTVKVEELLKKNKGDLNNILNQINDHTEKKIDLLRKDLSKSNETFQSSFDGRVQGIVVESESRLKNDIKVLQDAIEDIYLKYENRKDDDDY